MTRGNVFDAAVGTIEDINVDVMFESQFSRKREVHEDISSRVSAE